MATRYKAHASGNQVSFEFPATQIHMADAAGLTAVHVNWTLKSLRNAELVAICGRTVHILDWDELARIGEFDPAYLQTKIKPEERFRIVETT